MTRRDRKRLKRRRPNKNKKFRLIILSILLTFAVIFVLGKLSNKRNKANDKKDEETITETKDNENVETEKEKSEEIKETEEIKEVSSEKKLREIKARLDKKNDDLNGRIDNYLNDNKIDQKYIELAYQSIDKDNQFRYSSDTLVPLSKYNAFILSMLAEDLSKEKVLNLQDTLDLSSIEDIDENKFVSYEQLIKDSIIKEDISYLEATMDLIEKTQDQKWYDIANSKYGINITNDNKISINDIIKLANILISKEEDKYIYQDTINTLMQNANEKSTVDKFNESNFLVYIGGSQFEYNFEMGIIFGEASYIYTIYTPFSKETTKVDLRNILNSWVNDYK